MNQPQDNAQSHNQPGAAGARLAEPTLLACPFCGGKAEVKIGARIGYYVRCALFANDCDVHPQTTEHRTANAAAKYWNRRHANAGTERPRASEDR